MKICLAGYPFAGKKEQAERISKKFGLDIFVMETLVQEAIDFYAAHPDPIKPPAKPEAEQKSEQQKEASEKEDAASSYAKSDDKEEKKGGE